MKKTLLACFLISCSGGAGGISFDMTAPIKTQTVNATAIIDFGDGRKSININGDLDFSIVYTPDDNTLGNPTSPAFLEINLHDNCNNDGFCIKYAHPFCNNFNGAYIWKNKAPLHIEVIAECLDFDMSVHADVSEE